MDWGLVFEIGEWAIRLAMIPLVAREHRVEVALGWLGLILLVPYAGAPLYFLFGEMNLRYRLKAHAQVHRELDSRLKLREQLPPLSHLSLSPPVRHLADLTGRLTQQGAFPVMPGNAVELVAGQEDGIVRLIQDIDRERVIVTTPSFIPNETLLVALRLVSLGGGRLDLIVPRKSDSRLAEAVARTYLDPLLAAGTRIHFFPDGLLHARSMSVDGQVSVIGSANYDRRSLFVNYEVNLVVFDPVFTANLQACQEKLMGKARELPRDWWHDRPRNRKMLDQTLKLLSPLL